MNKRPLSYTTYIRQSDAIRRLISLGLNSIWSGRKVSSKTHSRFGKWSARYSWCQIARRNLFTMRNSPPTCTPTSHTPSIKRVLTYPNATTIWLCSLKSVRISKKRTRTSISLNSTISGTFLAKKLYFRVSLHLKSYRKVTMRNLSLALETWNSA